MADIDPNLAEASAKLTELFNQLGTSIRTGMDASESSVRVAERTQSSLETELKKFGLKINELTKDLEDDDDELKKRIKLQKEVNETIAKGIKAEADAKGVSVETLKLQKEQNTATEKQLRNLQEQRDAILGLTREQNASIEAYQKENKLRQIQADSTTHQGAKISAAMTQMSTASGILSAAQNAANAQFGATAKGAMGVNLAFTALNIGLDAGILAFNQWKEGLDNAFQAQMAYNTALISGADGYKLANTQQLAKMKLDAKQTREQSDMYQKVGFGLGATAIGLVALRSSTIAATFGMAALGGPVTLVITGLTALAALFGLSVAKEKYLQAQAEEKAAIDLENATTLKDKLYDTYMDIGKAGLVGSQGLTALTENAHKAGFAIKDIDKFTSALKNNQKEMSMFAGGAAAGVDKFASVTGEMTAELGGHFRNLGISVEEQAEKTAQYMALQSRLGLLQGKTVTELATGAGKYLEELDKSATLLGTSRKEQEDARKAVMAIEQLRAAQMVAEEKNDKAESERLGRYAKIAENLIAKGLTQEGAGIAKIAASKGAVTDKDTVIARQMYSNDVFNKIDKNLGSATDQMRQVVKESKSAYLRTAAGYAATGADAGMTGGKYGAMADLDIAVGNQEAAVREAAAKKGLTEGTPEYNKFFEDFLVSQKKATDKATIDANKLREQQQKDAITEDNRLIGFGNSFGGSITKFSNAVDKFAGKTASEAETQSTAGSTALRAAQQGASDQVAANYTKSQMTPEEAKNVLDNGSKRDIAAFGGTETLTKMASGAPAAPAAEAAGLAAAPAAAGGAAFVGPSTGRRKPSAPVAAPVAAPAAASMQRMNLSVPNAAGPAVQGGSGRGGQGGASFNDMSALIPDSPPPPQDSKITSGTKPTAALPAGGSATGLDSKGPPGGKFKNKDEFVKTMWPWAQYVSSKLGAPALGILGQWGGETGGGTSLPSEYNYAGIKAGDKFAKGDYVLTEERYNQKQLERAMKSGESLAGVLGKDDTMKKKGKNVTVDQWYGDGKPVWQLAQDQGLNWVQVKSYFAKFNNLQDFADGYVSFLKNPRYAEALKSEDAASFGKSVAKAGYATADSGTYSKKVADFAKNANVSAANGGIVNGPSSGFPATLHGNEIITPLSPNSILEQLGKTPATTEIAGSSSSSTSNTIKEIYSMNTEIMEMLAGKLDDMIDKLDRGNNYSDKLVKAMA